MGACDAWLFGVTGHAFIINIDEVRPGGLLDVAPTVLVLMAVDLPDDTEGGSRRWKERSFED